MIPTDLKNIQIEVDKQNVCVCEIRGVFVRSRCKYGSFLNIINLLLPFKIHIGNFYLTTYFSQTKYIYEYQPIYINLLQGKGLPFLLFSYILSKKERKKKQYIPSRQTHINFTPFLKYTNKSSYNTK